MQYVTLGRSGLRVSQIALGTAQFWDPEDSDGAIAMIRGARDLGINFFDSARTYGYGQCEAVLGAALRDDLRRNRDQVVLASKGGLEMTPKGPRRDASPAKLRQDVEESLAALGVDQIDLYHVHWPDPYVPFSESAGALEDLVAEGKIGHVGLSNFNVDEIDEFAKTSSADTLQPAYHLFSRDIEADLLPYADQRDMGVLVYGALGHGLLTGTLTDQMVFPEGDWRSYSPMYQGEAYGINLSVVRALQRLARERLGCSVGQLAIAWVLAHPAVDVAIVGTGRRDHVGEAISAAEIFLSRTLLADIDEIMESAMPSPGPTPETTPLMS